MATKQPFTWADLYRPKTVQECILPSSLKDKFQGFIDAGKVPNLLLKGPGGTGKTTVALAMCEELGLEPFFVNSSLARNIDTLRTDITEYASTGSLLNPKQKVVILDEGDNLNAQSTQPALRAFIEKYAASCNFILTCNYPNRIMKELRNRFTNIEFSIPNEEAPEMAGQFFHRCEEILKDNDIMYEQAVLAEVVKYYFPDFRRTLIELQALTVGKELNTSALRLLGDANVNDLIEIMKSRQFDALRKWVADVNTDSSAVYRQIYDNANQYLEPTSIPGVILALNEGQVNDAVVADRELNLMATLTTIMADAKFK